MTISLASVREIIKQVTPDLAISEKAIRSLRDYLEKQGMTMATQAAMIHQRENSLRRTIGEDPKVRLSVKQMDMAIKGRFVEAEEDHAQ